MDGLCNACLLDEMGEWEGYEILEVDVGDGDEE